jgi:hypothetical protein
MGGFILNNFVAICYQQILVRNMRRKFLTAISHILLRLQLEITFNDLSKHINVSRLRRSKLYRWAKNPYHRPTYDTDKKNKIWTFLHG